MPRLLLPCRPVLWRLLLCGGGAIVLLLLFFSADGATTRPAVAQSAFSCANVTEIPQPECQALVTFYNSTNGPTWVVKSGWLATNTPCTWYGVTCTGNHVTMLMLPDNGLNGGLPPELGALIYLRVLDLAENPPAAMALQRDAPALSADLQPALTTAERLSAISLASAIDHTAQQVEARAIVSNTRPALDNNPLTAAATDQPVDLYSRRTLTESSTYLRNQQTILDPVRTSFSFGIVDSVADNPAIQNLSWQEQKLVLAGSKIQNPTVDGVNRLTGPLPAAIGNWRGLQWLDLSGNQLTGALPAELAFLTNLFFLDLYNNGLGGPLPTYLGSLTNLETLDLGGNRFTGAIPPALGNLAGLKNFGLCGNGLSGPIPPELGRLTNLNVLFLCYNGLRGPIPAELGMLAALQSLRLDVNGLSGPIPANLGALVNLQTLRLESNDLSGPIPLELGNLHNLTQLWLSSNRLSGAIPPQLGQLQQLRFLSLMDNRLSGSIPAELGQLTNLLGLSLQVNRLSGAIPPALGQLANLLLLDLQTNDLSGAIPLALGNLRQLRSFSLGGNQLSGPIPEELTQLTGLTTLALYDNQLTGPLPPALGNLRQLTQLLLYNNRLSGPIPATLGNLGGLHQILLFGNQLHGEIPAQLGNLINLDYLWLGENQLTGGIPGTFGALTNLDSLWLQDNRLSGPLPNELGRLPKLADLRLSNNGFSGEVPPSFGNLKALQDLWLYNNQLSGPLPPTLGELSNLRYLWLGGNYLSGTVPASLGRLTNLEMLWLYSNRFSGPIPPELGNLTALQVLRLYDNSLNGSIPPELGQLTNLTHLELDLNQLSGELPAALAQLQELTNLEVSGNQLSGPIPAALGQLSQLRTLWLNDNRLQGAIPATLGNLSHLAQLSLQRNQLSGALPPQLGNLTNLEMLRVSANRLSGPLPAELGKLVNLLELNLYANDLRGAIPLDLTQLTRLVTLDLGNNQLTTTDDALRAFLTSKAPTWEATQTLPPTSVQALPERSDAIALSWTPIAYGGDGGAYAVEVATSADGPYTLHGRTVDKRTPGYTVDGLTPNTTYFFRVRTYTPAGSGQPNELWSDYSAPVSATTSNISGVGDGYENDDTCAQARAIVTNGYFDHHNFHQSTDVDWVQFTARAGVAYRIDVQAPADSTVDVALKLYAGCADPNPQQSNESFSPGVQYNFTAPSAGAYYLQLRNERGTAGANATYQIAVRALDGETANGAVILLGGRLYATDDVQANIDHVTATLYQMLLNNGYNADNIYYLSTVTSASGGDTPGVDGAATLANLQFAITTWAKNRVSESRSLTLYLIDHGDKGIFYVDETQGQRLTPAQLDEWLDQLEETAPNVAINVLIEACHSGSFITGFNNAGSLSKAGRVIMTSTNLHNLAFASEQGAYFSDYLFTALRQGHHLFSGFWEARIAARQATNLIQDPWLDADGDGAPNELEDAAIAARRTLFPVNSQATSQLWPPYIASLQEAAGVSGQRQLQADVRDNGAITRVWAVIYPPGYQPPTSGNELTPDNAPKADFVLVGDRYQLNYSGFTQPGLYRVVVNAEDSDGLQARPAVITVNTAAPVGGQFEDNTQVYLPLVTR